MRFKRNFNRRSQHLYILNKFVSYHHVIQSVPGGKYIISRDDSRARNKKKCHPLGMWSCRTILNVHIAGKIK